MRDDFYVYVYVSVYVRTKKQLIPVAAGFFPKRVAKLMGNMNLRIR